jgi:hypothetical protein
LPRFYIAASFGNGALMQRLARELSTEPGWVQTLDWAAENHDWPVQAAREIDAVVGADLLVVLLSPGKAQRGTHCEIGAALAAGRQVLIFAEDESHAKTDGYACVFHDHPLCRYLTCSFDPPTLASYVHSRFQIEHNRPVLNQLCDAALRIANDHGFTDATPGEDIALMHSELSEALEDIRAGLPSTNSATNQSNHSTSRAACPPRWPT